jgi:broad specificity phosphatase PhoE
MRCRHGGGNASAIKEEVMMTAIARLALLAAAAFWSLPSFAQTPALPAEWINSLRAGGHVIVLRHGATHADQADTDPLNIKNTAQQRQLNDKGRELAGTIGESMRKLKIPIGQIHSSMFQRAIDTGTLLGLGNVTTSIDISEGGLVVTPNENNRRAQALRKLAATAPPAGANAIVVTHKPNIMDAFGKDWFDVREGEASVFKPDGNGSYRLVVRIQADEWSKLAQAGSN